MKRKKLAVIDFETGGLDPKNNPPLRLGYQLIVDGLLECEKELKIEPWRGAVVEAKALEANGIKKSELYTDTITLVEALTTFVEDVNNHIDTLDRNDRFTIMAYNAPFDMGFLQYMMDVASLNMFRWFNYHTVDPLAILRVLRYEGKINISSLKLKDVFTVITGQSYDSHTALADCRACYTVHQHLVEEYLK